MTHFEGVNTTITDSISVSHCLAQRAKRGAKYRGNSNNNNNN